MMTPDSTQSDTKGSTKVTVSKRKSSSSSGGETKAAQGEKQPEAKKKPKVTTGSKTSKPKIKKKSKKNSSPQTEDKGKLENDEDAEWMDLSLDLQPISAYMKNRDQMLEEMFKTIKGEKLRSMLPEVMKKCTFEELRTLCLDQLEVMSKKRIQHILTGEEMMSSSDTDDTTDDDDTRCSKREASSSNMLESSAIVDSTCTSTEVVDPGAAAETTEVAPQPGKSSGENTPALSLSPDHGELDNLFADKEGGTVEEEMVENDHRETESQEQQPTSDTTETAKVKLRAESETEPALDDGTADIQEDIDRTVNSIIGGGGSEVSKSVPLPSTPLVSVEREDAAVAVPTKTQMEILELELRARAIKALMKQQEQRERAGPSSTSP